MVLKIFSKCDKRLNSWHFDEICQSNETNIPFLDCFEAYVEAKQIDYPFGKAVNTYNKNMQT